MKIFVVPDEWWPVYILENEGSPFLFDHETEIEATEVEIRRWKRAEKLFEKAQEEIRERLGLPNPGPLQ